VRKNTTTLVACLYHCTGFYYIKESCIYLCFTISQSLRTACLSYVQSNTDIIIQRVFFETNPKYMKCKSVTRHSFTRLPSNIQRACLTNQSIQNTNLLLNTKA